MRDLDSLMRDLVKAQCGSLTLWNCIIDGEVYSAKGQRLENKIIWVNYFNIGVDAKIGLEVEKRRGLSRCANYFQIAWLMPLYLFGWCYTDVRK